MKIKQASLETCQTATGTVVVIDVLRAFTTAAFAFEAGAQNIILVDTVDEALKLRRQLPNALAMGEVDSLPVKEFDFNNSPSQLAGLDLRNHQLIQRTSAGTQGVVRSVQADTLLAGSFVCAGATVEYLKRHAPASVTFVITGAVYGRDGDEDIACADYLTACLRGPTPNPQPYLQRVYNSTAGQIFVNSSRPEHPLSDLERSMELDRFNFAMQVQRRNGRLTLNKVELEK